MSFGGGGGGQRGLEQEEKNLINLQTQLGAESGAREATIFNELFQASQDLRGEIPGLQSQIGALEQDLFGARQDFLDIGQSRAGAEDALLRNALGLPSQVAGLGNEFAAIRQPQLNSANLIPPGAPPGSFSFRRGPVDPNTGQQIAGQPGVFDASFQDLSGGNQFALQGTPGIRGLAGNLTNPALISDQVQLAQQAQTEFNPALQGALGNLSFQGVGASGDAVAPVSSIGGLGNAAAAVARRNEQELFPLRGQTVQNLTQIAQGQTPQAVQNLANVPGQALQRDILEAQFQNARNRLIEQGQAGGGLNANLAGLEAQRALGVAGIQAQQAAAEQQLNRDLFGAATQAGLGANQDQANLLRQGADIFGLQGQQGIGSEQVRQSAIGLGGNLIGDIQQQRLASQALSGNLLNQAEQQRQSGLTGAIGALDAAVGRDLASIIGEQQALASGQQLQQALAGQLGRNADQFLLSEPNLIGQQAGLAQSNLAASTLPATLLQGVNITPASSFLGPAQQSVSSSLNAAAANRAQSQGALTEGLFGLGGAGLGLLAAAFI